MIFYVSLIIDYFMIFCYNFRYEWGISKKSINIHLIV